MGSKSTHQQKQGQEGIGEKFAILYMQYNIGTLVLGAVEVEVYNQAGEHKLLLKLLCVRDKLSLQAAMLI